MNLPGVVVDLPTLTQKDIDDIVLWGIPNKIDFIAASFVRKAEDIIKIQQVLKDNGGEGIQIICKIENQEGMENYEEILNVTDAVMVARGDLGMEVRFISFTSRCRHFCATFHYRSLLIATIFVFPSISLFLPFHTSDSTGKGVFGSKDDDSFCQHCREARRHGYTNVGKHDYQPSPDSCRVLGCKLLVGPFKKRQGTFPVSWGQHLIVARFFFLFVQQVANAVLDGTDCVMLSGETANGDYPTAAVKIMSQTCCEAESAQSHNMLYQAVRNSTLARYGTLSVSESIASSGVKTAIDVNAKALIVCSESGRTARQVAKFRPGIPIHVLTSDERVARQCSGIVRCCVADVCSELTESEIESQVEALIKKFRKDGVCNAGDAIVVVAGMIPKSGQTNVMVKCKSYNRQFVVGVPVVFLMVRFSPFILTLFPCLPLSS
jgi:Pyruvate kinase, barrel domain/Pyruvate kinase, alpha/beta domain